MGDIKIRDNGPYIVKGSFTLVDADGKAFETNEAIALCRCGHSANKPFCDGKHGSENFTSAPRAGKTS